MQSICALAKLLLGLPSTMATKQLRNSNEYRTSALACVFDSCTRAQIHLRIQNTGWFACGNKGTTGYKREGLEMCAVSCGKAVSECVTEDFGLLTNHSFGKKS